MSAQPRRTSWRRFVESSIWTPFLTSCGSTFPAATPKLRRTAENLPAVIGHMADHDPQRFRQLVTRVRNLVEHEVTGIEVIRSELNDVMLALREDGAITPAREMSDGLLRFAAIATSLLRQGQDLDLGVRGTEGDGRSPTLVIEELENGLHPSQATQILDLVRQATQEDASRVIFTTHSPALLSALGPEDHQYVIVCSRDRDTGLSHLRKLPEVDGYPSLMAQGDLGTVVTSGLLEQPRPAPARDFTEFDQAHGNRLAVGRRVEFVDTSVLCNLLDVPGKNQDRKNVLRALEERRACDLILPVTAVIETGQSHRPTLGRSAP